MRLNWRAQTLCEAILNDVESLHVGVQEIHEATVLDFGNHTAGGIEAGLLLAQICLGNLGRVTIGPQSFCGVPIAELPTAIQVTTDHPTWACLGGQYAGWPVQTDDFFAMGSGPMRLARGREEMLEHLQLVHVETSETEVDWKVVGVLETDQEVSVKVIETIAADCGVQPSQLILAVAPVTSLAGTVQVVARSIETALHKMHALGIDPRKVRSAQGIAPLPPVAHKTIQGIGRTNDAILYGGHVTLWVDMNDEEIEQVGAQIPSCSSKDHGRPFAEVFANYEYDFYRVDPLLFSPAVVTFVNLRSGKSFRFGEFAPNVLRNSFGLNNGE